MDRDTILARIPTRRRGLVPPAGIRFRTEPGGQPAGGGGGGGEGSGGQPAGGQPGGQGGGSGGQGAPPAGSGGGQGGSGGQGGQPAGGQGEPAGGPSGAAAAQRLLQKAEKERDEALRKLQEKEDAELDEKQKAEKRAADAERKAAEAEERATKVEVRSKLRAAATGKVAVPEAVVDLSEGKLLDLKDADDKELEAHVTELVQRYSLPAAQGGQGGGQPQGFGQPAGGQGGQPAGGAPAGTQDAGAGQATGDPSKDYRGGIGAGILGILRQKSGVAPPGDEGQ